MRKNAKKVQPQTKVLKISYSPVCNISKQTDLDTMAHHKIMFCWPIFVVEREILPSANVELYFVPEQPEVSFLYSPYRFDVEEALEAADFVDLTSNLKIFENIPLLHYLNVFEMVSFLVRQQHHIHLQLHYSVLDL